MWYSGIAVDFENSYKSACYRCIYRLLLAVTWWGNTVTIDQCTDA